MLRLAGSCIVFWPPILYLFFTSNPPQQNPVDKPAVRDVAEYPSPPTAPSYLYILQCMTIQTQLYHSPLADTIINFAF